MQKLTKKQLTWYGIAGIGPNMLNLMVGSYLCDALMTQGFEENIENWTYLNKTLVSVVIWSILVTIAKVIDGVVDVPLGSWTDRLKTKWGKRRPSLLIGIVFMLISYGMFLIVPVQNVGADGSIFNTIWFGFWLAAFYTFYTLTMVTYYATFSEVTANEVDRVYLSNIKSTVDIIYFVLGYALIPALVGSANIRILALLVLVLMPSMIIPFKLIKERSTLPADVEKYKAEHPEDVEAQIETEPTMIESIKYTLKNKDFLIWMGLYGALQFGLSMFLTGFNVYYSGTMGFSGLKTMLCNVAAFGPVPFTLILYNYLVKKKGFRFGYRFSLIMFAVGMAAGVFCRTNLIADDTIRLVCAMCANCVCSFGIGSFFSVAYTIPSQIAADEKAKTGVSHPAMYFAIQGLFEAVVAAISTGIVWVNLKNIPASESFLLNPAGGSGLLTFIVSISCIIACVLSIFLPKSLINVGKVNKKEGE